MINLTMLCQLIEQNLNVRTTVSDNQILFTIGVTSSRNQTVLITMNTFLDGQVVEVKSRCGVVTKANTVRQCLRRNLISPLGGIAMDTSTQPKTIDIIQRLAIPNGLGVNIPELLATITSVAIQADTIEEKMGLGDIF